MIWVWLTGAFLGGMVFGIIVIALCAANDAAVHSGKQNERKEKVK